MSAGDRIRGVLLLVGACAPSEPPFPPAALLEPNPDQTSQACRRLGIDADQVDIALPCVAGTGRCGQWARARKSEAAGILPPRPLAGKVRWDPSGVFDGPQPPAIPVVVWGGALAWRAEAVPELAVFAGDIGGHGLIVNCLPGDVSSVVVTAHPQSFRDAEEILQQAGIRPDGDLDLRLPSGLDPGQWSVHAMLEPGQNVSLHTGRVGTAGITAQGDCGAIHVSGPGVRSVSVNGWHKSIDIDAPAAEVYVRLDPGSEAVNDLRIRSERPVRLSLPARAPYRGSVPSGWQVVCIEGTDPDCGRQGPFFLGRPGNGGFLLDAPTGLIEIVSWHEGEDLDGRFGRLRGRLESKIGSPEGIPETVFVGQTPPCYDVFRKGCGRPWDACLPETLPDGRRLSPGP